MYDVTLDELLDEAKIERVLVRYATMLDGRNWAGLEEVFASDAVAHYHGIGSFRGLEAITGVVRGFLELCGATQHMVSNVRISVKVKEATAKCYVQATHAGRGGYEGHTMTVWGEYSDQLKLRPEGWRIVHRELSVQHVTGDVGVMLKAQG